MGVVGGCVSVWITERFVFLGLIALLTDTSKVMTTPSDPVRVRAHSE